MATDTEIRKLGFDPHTDLLFFDTPQHYGATDPTPAEVADLLARVLEAAGHELPEMEHRDNDQEPEAYRGYLLEELARWRAALARDAAKAAEDREVEALAEASYDAWSTHVAEQNDAERTPWSGQAEWVKASWRAVARRNQALGARPNGGA